MNKWIRTVLVLLAVACFAVALSYPIRYRMARESNNGALSELSSSRQKALAETETERKTQDTVGGTEAETGTGIEKTVPEKTEDESAAAGSSETERTAETEPVPQTEVWEDVRNLLLKWPGDAAAGQLLGADEEAIAAPEYVGEDGTPVTIDRSVRTQAVAYPFKEKVTLDESRILKELADIYEVNHDLVGWIRIDGTVIDYPVVQCEDSDFYLKHDFYGEENVNGQIILDTKCDPYTPSYNLVISGHHMRNGSMFGGVPQYQDISYWREHRLVEFDTLMSRGTYVVFGAFFSADYDEDEEGFRYNTDIQYRVDADQWLAQIRENRLYDTGIDVAYGDEFITLTTCDRSRRSDGRFVLVCRKLREGEVIE